MSKSFRKDVEVDWVEALKECHRYAWTKWQKYKDKDGS